MSLLLIAWTQNVALTKPPTRAFVADPALWNAGEAILAPTTVPECLLIEPTETESLTELDRFLSAMESIYQEIMTQPALLKNAPHNQVIKRVNEVKAAKELIVSETL